MRQYRLYCLDGAGSINLAEWIDASDDADAVRQARERFRGSITCEVWLDKRLVATIDRQELSA
jgi:hypothetical protein